MSQKKHFDAGGILDLCGPLLLYLVVNLVTGAAMEMAWLYGLRDFVLAGRDPAETYSALGVWSVLCLIVPAGAGCLSIRREALCELAGFGKKAGEERLSGIGLSLGMLSVLFISALCLALGINLLVSLFTDHTGLAQALPAAPPGPAGFALSAAVYGIYMPFIEEVLFRGILFSRLLEAGRRRQFPGSSAKIEESGVLDEWQAGLSGESDTPDGRQADFPEEGGIPEERQAVSGGREAPRAERMAVLLSAALFGLYHGALLQGIYAFAMGILFALAYVHTGRFSIPWGLHGACNLCILFLQWTDRYRALCTPAWAAAFSVLAAAGFFTIRQMRKNARIRF